MDNSTKRRGFIKSLGLAGLVAVGFEAYKRSTQIVYKQDEFPSEELEKQLENKPVLALQATYGTPKPREQNQYMIIGYGEDYVEGTKKQVQVQLVPGPDGKLYVKENDTWRKI